MAKETNEGKIMKKNDLHHPEEWETTRHLYALLYLTSTMQNLLLARLEPRFARHGVVLKQSAKYNFNKAHQLIKDAAKYIDASEMEGSRMGYHGDADFVALNTALNKEGYFYIRCMLAIQNALKYLTWDAAEKILEYLNGLTTGFKRIFTKKMIDTFKLEEDK